MKKIQSRDLLELEDLRARLQEAEETLRAIRNNEIDALVVDGQEGQQVFTLQGAESPYRIFMETMIEGAATVTPEGTVLYCNRRLADMLKVPLNRIIGSSLGDFIAPDEREPLLAMLQACGVEGCRGEVLFFSSDGQDMPTSFTGRTLTLDHAKALCVVIADLTEQKRTEKELEKAREELEEKVLERTAQLSETNKALWESEARFRSLFTDMTEGLCLHRLIYDENGEPINYEILDVNPQYEAILKVDREAAVHKLATEVYGILKPPYLAEYAKVVATGQPYHFETHFPPMNKFFYVSVSPMGRDTFATIFFDITEGKQAEEVLRTSEERYRLLVETMLQGVVHQDASGKIIAMNPAAERILGKSPAEFLGSTSVDVQHLTLRPDGTPFPGQEHPSMKALETGEPISGVVMGVFNPREQAYRWINITAVPVLWPGEIKISEVYTVFEDITEREQAEKALKRSERLYRAIGESIDYGVWVCEADGRNVYASESFLKMVGITQEQCSSFGWGDVLHPDDTERTITAWKECVQAGGIWDIEHRFRGVDGQWHHVLARGVPVLDEQGEVTHWAGINLDISGLKQAELELQKARDELELRVEERTALLREAYDSLRVEAEERQNTERQLRHAQKMEALGTLTGGIAHDFNNILAAMIGFAELAKDRASKGSRQELHLQRVLDAGQRARELVRQMLTFSRRTEQEKTAIRLSGAIRETVKLLRASLPSTIDVQVKIESESGLILADPVQLQQVLMNLCTNASYAMREKGGVLDIELSDYSVSPENGREGIRQGAYMKLVVRDTGDGIPAHIIDRIFDPFFTTKAEGEGTGLGLSIVHGIIENHYGYIMAESKPGKGSAFTVYLPKVAEARTISPQGEQQIPLGHERILFVDDEPALVEMGEEILTGLGYEVVSKGSSREALAVLRLDPARFDLVITDQTMPHMTGVELAKEIHTIRADIPVILCTGFSNLVDENIATETGIKAFSMKPLTKGEMARTIRRVLDG